MPAFTEISPTGLPATSQKSDSRLDIVDVAPIQIENVMKKTGGQKNVGAHLQDSTDMAFPAGSFDQTVVFFLLHEQPEYARRKTVEEAIRVTRPGGKVIFVDYHGPKRNNPMRYVMKPILATLEPYAMDLWREELPGVHAGKRQARAHPKRFLLWRAVPENYTFGFLKPGCPRLRLIAYKPLPISIKIPVATQDFIDAWVISQMLMTKATIGIVIPP